MTLRKINTSKSIRMPEESLPMIDAESPMLHTLTVAQHSNGSTAITARVMLAGGYQNKRLIFPRPMTIKEISEALLNVEAW